MRKGILGKAGFTLVELLIAISVMSVLTAITVVSFSQYSRSQTLKNAVLDVATMINLAKSRAQTQVKPTSSVCTGKVHKGYAVVIDRSESKYELHALCENASGYSTQDLDSEEFKTLPQTVTFDADSTVGFEYLTGKVVVLTGSSTITLLQGSSTETVTVHESGAIQVSE